MSNTIEQYQLDPKWLNVEKNIPLSSLKIEHEVHVYESTKNQKNCNYWALLYPIIWRLEHNSHKGWCSPPHVSWENLRRDSNAFVEQEDTIQNPNYQIGKEVNAIELLNIGHLTTKY